MLVHEFFGALLREKVLRHFVDEDFFGGAVGLVFITESLEENLGLFILFLFHESEVGAEAVTESVLAGGHFTFRGTGTGGFLGVAAIGFDLGLSGHGYSWWG